MNKREGKALCDRCDVLWVFFFHPFFFWASHLLIGNNAIKEDQQRASLSLSHSLILVLITLEGGDLDSSH